MRMPFRLPTYHACRTCVPGYPQRCKNPLSGLCHMSSATVKLEVVSDKGSAALFVLGIIAAVVFIQAATNLHQALLFLLGIGLGITLLHAMFGFSGGWRNLIRKRESSGVRAQLILLMLTSILFFPILGGLWPGINANAALAPVGYAVLVGACLFGIGMQLGGGCGSGTLFTMGQGQLDMLLTLVFFIVGATVASSHLDWWHALGDIGTVSLIQSYGWPGGLLINLTVLGSIYILVRALDKHKHTELKPVFAAVPRQQFAQGLIFGGWPLWWAVLSLAILNLVTLMIAGHPWSITFAFSLWGTKLWSALGADISNWQYWQTAYPATALNNSVLFDTTSVMNFGLIGGAGLAAALAGRFAPEGKISLHKLFAVIIGGLLLGYGARLAFGCNIGALLAGISSGSLHGWLWLVAAFIGNMIGSHLRYTIKLDKRG